MFYENNEVQLAYLHSKNKNNNALNSSNNTFKQERVILNIVLIGMKNIGKSKLIQQFVEKIFFNTKKSNSLDIIYQKFNEQKLHLKFHQIDLTSYHQNNNLILADCILFVYDIGNQISFNYLIDYCFPLISNNRFEHICSYSLIGIKNKTTRQVNQYQVERFVKKFQLFSYEITSRSNYEELLKELLDNYFQIKSQENRLFYIIKRKLENLFHLDY